MREALVTDSCGCGQGALTSLGFPSNSFTLFSHSCTLCGFCRSSTLGVKGQQTVSSSTGSLPNMAAGISVPAEQERSSVHQLLEPSQPQLEIQVICTGEEASLQRTEQLARNAGSYLDCFHFQ